MKTKDLTQSKLQIIKNYFPSCVTETKINGEVVLSIDFDLLKQELSGVIVEGCQERYQFTWPEKRKFKMLANKPSTCTLRPCEEESVNYGNTHNLYIEGDNLEVLKILRETYLEKIKMIYIDPPYNTGKDFLYNDNFASSDSIYQEVSGCYDELGNRLVINTETNGRFHTDWLNMIYPRLLLAKDFLSKDGIILINIDENEITNLQKVCSEIFGESNCIGTIIWDKRNPKGDSRGIACQNEYIVCYAKNAEALYQSNGIMRPKKNATAMIAKAKQLFNKIDDHYSLEEANNDFKKWLSSQDGLSGGERAYNMIDANGDLYQAVSMSWPNKKQAPPEYFIPLIHPITNKPCPVPEKGWRNPPKTMDYLLKNNLILFGNDETTQPRCKYLLKDHMYENIPSLLYNGGSDSLLLKKLGIPFDTPKMVSICKEHIASFTSKDDIIMDFFSGSATIGHAVMEQNSEDGGNRRFILVQLPEMQSSSSEMIDAGFTNICELGKERLRRSGKAYPNVDVGFRVLKLDSSNMKDVYYSSSDATRNSLDDYTDLIKSDRRSEDLLFQIMLELGVELSSKIEQRDMHGHAVFSVDDGYLVACFDDSIDDSTVTELSREMTGCMYAVFRSGSSMTDEMLANIEQIFKTYSPQTKIRIL
ncbi:site-specific DNA-methyltransferase [Methanomethylophilus alvi]|uniref:site-specific DNA-methyltransferase n=1 Tax=Methanomethylophilus alvi TaxID=1291540 RepID=UPI0037DC14BE